MKFDAKVYAMIDDLSDSALNYLMCRHGFTVADGPMHVVIGQAYEDGIISADEIITEWENDDDENDENL